MIELVTSVLPFELQGHKVAGREGIEPPFSTNYMTTVLETALLPPYKVYIRSHYQGIIRIPRLLSHLSMHRFLCYHKSVQDSRVY